MPKQISRRRFVATVAVGLGGSMLVRARGAEPSRWRFFTEAEARLVDAITDQIIPADQDPGARDVGVVNFIDKQLTGPYRRHQAAYRKGLAAVDEASQTRAGHAFTELSGEQQLAILKAFEASQHRAFFNLIRDHTMQGFYGGPQHGGNRGYASYKMLGLDYPQIIGQNRYRRS